MKQRRKSTPSSDPGEASERHTQRTFIHVSASVRSFTSTDHLNPEAVAAFVDNELTASAAHRARSHLVHCLECRREVERQRRAAEMLRASCSTEVEVPSEFLERLMGIAASCPEGPCAEDTLRTPETLLDKLDSFARAMRRHHGGR